MAGHTGPGAGEEPPLRLAPPGLTDLERRVFGALETVPVSVDELVTALGGEADGVLAAVHRLTVLGAARRTPGGGVLQA